MVRVRVMNASCLNAEGLCFREFLGLPNVVRDM